MVLFFIELLVVFLFFSLFKTEELCLGNEEYYEYVFKSFLHYQTDSIFKIRLEPNIECRINEEHSCSNSLSLSAGEYINIKLSNDYCRNYSVLSSTSDNFIEILVKNQENSRMVEHFKTLETGDNVLVRIGGGFQYEINSYSKIGLICGGTGISSCYQILKEKVMNKEKDNTLFSIIYGAVRPNELMFWNELNQINEKQNDINIYFMLDKLPSDEELLKSIGLSSWKERIGYVTKYIIKETMPPPSDNILILSSGPPMMIKILKKMLSEMGYSKENLFFYS